MKWAYLVGVIGIVATFIADIRYSVDYELAANISLVYFAIVTTVFVLLYGFRSRWQDNEVGKVFFVKAIVLPAVLWQISAAVWIDADYPYRQQIRFALYTLAPVAYVVMVIVLVRQQRRDRERTREAESADVDENDSPAA
jgi:hypothetical protein